MSWDNKTDYCGLAIDGKLTIKGATENRSCSTLEKNGANGEIAATKYYANIAAPSCEYTVENTNTYASIKLGAVTKVGTENFALQSVSIKTSAGAEPTFSATSAQIEDDATDAGCSHFAVPSFVVESDEIAQTLFNAFTLSGTACELTECGAEISCTVGTSKVNGYPVASDVVAGKVTVTVTIGQYGDTKPSVTATSGWEMSAPLTCTDADSDLPSWTCSFTKPLTKTMHE